MDDLEQLVERYGAMGFHLPIRSKSFKPEDTRLAFGAHDELWGFDKWDAPESRAGQHGARGAPVQHIHRPPMENVKYYCNMSDAALRELLALAPEERNLQIWSKRNGRWFWPPLVLQQRVYRLGVVVRAVAAAASTPAAAAAACGAAAAARFRRQVQIEQAGGGFCAVTLREPGGGVRAERRAASFVGLGGR